MVHVWLLYNNLNFEYCILHYINLGGIMDRQMILTLDALDDDDNVGLWK